MTIVSSFIHELLVDDGEENDGERNKDVSQDDGKDSRQDNGDDNEDDGEDIDKDDPEQHSGECF